MFLLCIQIPSIGNFFRMVREYPLISWERAKVGIFTENPRDPDAAVIHPGKFSFNKNMVVDVPLDIDQIITVHIKINALPIYYIYW